MSLTLLALFCSTGFPVRLTVAKHRGNDCLTRPLITASHYTSSTGFGHWLILSEYWVINWSLQQSNHWHNLWWSVAVPPWQLRWIPRVFLPQGSNYLSWCWAFTHTVFLQDCLQLNIVAIAAYDVSSNQNFATVDVDNTMVLWSFSCANPLRIIVASCLVWITCADN